MGQIYSYLTPKENTKLCEDFLDNCAFAVDITIHSMDKVASYADLLEYLNKTHPVLGYTYCKSIYLLYDYDQKYPRFRSNMSGDIISELSSDVTRFCITNNICDVYYVEVNICVEPHDTSKTKLLNMIETNAYYGSLHGFDKITKEIIEEQFSDRNVSY